MKKILIIQTASIGDVILATALPEKLHEKYPDAVIDILVKKGNETLFTGHPFLRSVLIRDKSLGKRKSFISLLQQIYAEKYDHIINVQRYAFTALLTIFGGAGETSGFKGNLFSIFYKRRVTHELNARGKQHETERNQQLISHLTGETPGIVALYPSQKAYAAVSGYKTQPYICIAPASLWFTKQFPKERWVEVLQKLPPHYHVYLLGGKSDHALCGEIINTSGRENCLNLAGKLALLETAALMQHAVLNYVNDSAPLHLASAVNAPVAAVFCSTVTGFGFGPLSQNSHIIETKKSLNCRPCGNHGHKECPEQHFDCAKSIDIDDFIKVIEV
jgi:heptosyltransferase-2